MEESIRILHLEDSARDAELIRSKLEADSLVCAIVLARGKAEFETALAQGEFDVILCDYNIPGYGGTAAIAEARAKSPNTPLIVISGTLGEEAAVRCLKLGATDYVLKQRLERLPAAVRNALQAAQEHLARVEAERALRESEERFRLLAENSDDVFWFYGGTPVRTLYVSPAFERIWGIPTERLYRQPHLWREAAHPEDRPRVDAAFMSWAQGETPRYEEEYRVVRPDGSERWVRDSGTLVRDQAGRIVRLSGIARDTTIHRRSQEALRVSEERFRSAMEHSPIGMALVTPDGHWLEVNQALCQIVGYTEAEMRATNFHSITHPDDLGADLNHVRQLLAQRIDNYSMEKRYFHKDGRVVWIRLNASLVCDANAAPRYFIAQIQDITERKRNREMLSKLNVELERRVAERTSQLEVANQELESFSYSVSHDLRAPLRAIDGFSLALLEDYADKLDEEGKENIERVRAATQRMGHLIDDLLNLSHISRSKMRWESVDLSALAKNIAANLQRSQPERRVKFAIAEGLQANADLGLVRLVLENLIGNAWKFTGKRADAKIDFGVDLNNGKPAYFVRDNGAGFDIAYADKLFGAFQRLHSQSEFPGTGIGLATVRRIVRRHGGELWAEGKPNEGATFYFTLSSFGGEATGMNEASLRSPRQVGR